MDFKERFGSWALVTGASAGIGRALADGLAARGINLVMVARNRERLEEAAGTVQARYAVEALSVVSDLEHGIDEVCRATAALDVGLVVSNAALAPAGPFLDMPRSAQRRLLTVNAGVSMELAHHFARRLVDKRRAGGVLLLSSMCAYQGVPFFAHYAATKAYVLALGEALHHELAPAGVQVTVLVPGLTDTPSTKGHPDLDAAVISRRLWSAEAVASAGIDALARNQAVCVPGRLDRVMTALVPRASATRLWGRTLSKAVAARRKSAMVPA